MTLLLALLLGTTALAMTGLLIPEDEPEEDDDQISEELEPEMDVIPLDEALDLSEPETGTPERVDPGSIPLTEDQIEALRIKLLEESGYPTSPEPEPEPQPETVETGTITGNVITLEGGSGTTLGDGSLTEDPTPEDPPAEDPVTTTGSTSTLNQVVDLMDPEGTELDVAVVLDLYDELSTWTDEELNALAQDLEKQTNELLRSLDFNPYSMYSVYGF